MISYSLFDIVCLFLILLLLLYKIRNKIDIIFYVMLSILIGFLILRFNNYFVKDKINKYYETFNSSLDIYYPSKKDGICNNNEEECLYPAINKKVDKKLIKRNGNKISENFTNSSLDIYYPDDSCKSNNCPFPAINKSLCTSNKYNNKKYEHTYNGTWYAHSGNIYNFLQKNDTLLLSVDNNTVNYTDGSRIFSYNVNKYIFSLMPDRLSFYNINDNDMYTGGELVLDPSGTYIILKSSDKSTILKKYNKSNINLSGFSSEITQFYNNNPIFKKKVILESFTSEEDKIQQVVIKIPNNICSESNILTESECQNNIFQKTHKYKLSSSTFNNIFNTDDLCIIDNKYYAVFLDPLNYSVLGINNNRSDLELSMHEYTELSNMLRYNFIPSMKLRELNELSNNTLTIKNDRKIYNVIRSLIESDKKPPQILTVDMIGDDFKLNNNDKITIVNIFNKINDKYENYDLDQSEFLKNVKSELNNSQNEEVNIFKVDNINIGQNTCDTTISFIPVNTNQPKIYNNNTEYFLIPNNNGIVDLSFQKLYSKNRIFRFENVHNKQNDSSGRIYEFFINHGVATSLVFDSYIRCNDGRYLNNSNHCISGEPYTWTVVLFKANDLDTLWTNLNNI